MSAAVDLLQDVFAVKAELSRRELRHFARHHWHIIEPEAPFISGWHIDACCEHIQAVIAGDLRFLVINEPPRMSKSTVVSVMAPAWSWIDRPALKWLCGSYAQPLSTRDARKSRQILDSDYFASEQVCWGTNITLEADQNQKQRYENTQSGYRLAISTLGQATGEGGDIISIDDPHNVRDGESDAKRQDTIQWIRETLPSRLNHRKKGGIIITMQRVHFEDASNEALTEMGFTHLNLPMEYQPKCIVDFPHRCSLAVEWTTEDGETHQMDEGSAIGFKDPRSEKGELLCPERADDEDIAQIKKLMTAHAYSGQYDQEPVAREGGMFKAVDFQVVQTPPSPIKKVWRAWDKAGRKHQDACFTAGVKMALLENGAICVMDCISFQEEAPKREKIIKRTAETDGRGTSISVEQEPGSGGLESAQATVRNLKGFKVKLDNPQGEGSKECRAEPWASSVENRDVFVLDRPWTKKYIEIHTRFPRSKRKDEVDASSQAFNRIAGRSRVHV